MRRLSVLLLVAALLGLFTRSLHGDGYEVPTTSISGNAATATALAVNGANCSAGSFPLGVDASGASESCTATAELLSSSQLSDFASKSGAGTAVLGHTITGITDGDYSRYDAATASWINHPGLQLKPSMAWFIDEFPTGGIGTTVIGQLGWVLGTIGAAPTNTRQDGIANHPSFIRMTTTATQGQGGSIALSTASTGIILGLGNTPTWESYFVFRLNQTANTRFRVGFIVDHTSVPATRFIGLRYDTATGFTDTNFIFECRDTGANTTSVSSGVAADTNFHTLRMWLTVSGTVNYSLDGGATQSNATNCPTVAIGPAFQLITDTTATVSMDVDFFSFRMTGLSR
jgi:hypothetical protein